MQRKNYLKELIASFLTDYKECPAFAIVNGKTVYEISYKTFAEDILKNAFFWRDNGYKNEHIALLTENRYDWLVAFFGILLSGNVCVSLNPDLPIEDLKHFGKKADVKKIWCSQQKKEEFQKEFLEVVISSDDIKSSELLSFDKIQEYNIHDLACILFTSGTTGESKGVMLTIGNLAACENNFLEMHNVYRSYLISPMYHIGGIRISLSMLGHGRTLCIGRGVKYIFADMALLNPDHIATVPGIMDSLAKILKRVSDSEKRKKYIGSNLKKIGLGGASSNKQMCLFLMEQGFDLGIGYAMTETTGCGLIGEFSEENVGCLGVPEDGMQCKIKDGEILLKGEGIMAGYYKDPEATSQIIKDGWLYTGDIGYRDDNGYYYLTGRKKNVIILANGENVNPEELEEKLGECDAILECMVYGDKRGICADIYAKNSEFAASFIKDYNGNVPTYRQIYKVNYYEEPLPKTASGKIKRKENEYV